MSFARLSPDLLSTAYRVGLVTVVYREVLSSEPRSGEVRRRVELLSLYNMTETETSLEAPSVCAFPPQFVLPTKHSYVY